MKTIKLIWVITTILVAETLQAQALVSINVIPPPLWGPAEFTIGRYYYLPEVEAYYDLDYSLFIYTSHHGEWVKNKQLPLRYRRYNLYTGYKIVLNDYLGDTPYTYFNEHKRLYGKSYRGAPQQTIGERPGRRSNKSKTGNSLKVLG